jgi:uncharacterized membrane protein YdjX (TVP38/TMEM64 family)
VQRRIAFILAILPFSAIAALWLFDLIPNPAAIKDSLRDAGPIGGLVFVASFTGLQPWGLPGSLFVIPAAMVWPPLVAFGLSWLGANLAALVAFLFARLAGRDWARSRLGPFLDTYDDRLASHGFVTVVVLRMLFVCAPPANWLLGVSRISLRTFLVGSAVGFVPGIALITLLGNRGLAAAEERSGASLLVLLAVLAVFALYQRRIRSALGRSVRTPVSEPSQEEPT